MSARTQWEVTDAAGAVHLINVERQDVREWIDRAPCDAVCEGCAAADDVVATIAAVDAEVSPC